MKTIAILDYDIGNVRSILNAFRTLNTNPIVTDKPEVIMQADGVVLPGVGAFATGMNNLKSHQLVDVIHQYIATGKPFLGICLGMQLLMEESDEFGVSQCLGLIQGRVEKLKVNHFRLPHISWNELRKPENISWENTIFRNVGKDDNFYFVHTFAANPKHDENILSTTVYDGYSFCSAVFKDNIYGVQFHPEKSAAAGLRILEDFTKL